MNKRELKAAYDCSTAGLIKLMKDSKYHGQKEKLLDDVVEYIARSGMKGTTSKDDVNELIQTARAEFIAVEAQDHYYSHGVSSYKNIKDVSNAGDTRIKNFIKNPNQALQGEFVNLAKKLNASNPNDYDQAEYEENVINNINPLNIVVIRSGEMGKNQFGGLARIDVTSRLTSKIADKNIDDAMKRVNGNWFTRMFRNKSNEYKAFEESLKTFREPGKVISGNTEDLEKKSTAYLKKIIPNFKYTKNMNKEEALRGLSGNKKARAELALNALESVNEHKSLKQYMENVENAIEGKKFDDKLDEKKAEQKEFQDNLILDISKDEPKLNDSNVAVEDKKLDKTIDDNASEKLDDSKVL